MNKLIIALACIVFKAGIAGQSAISFQDVTSQTGIAQQHNATYLITGQAWGDYDNDGWLDLYLTDNSGANTLYRNQGDGTFTVSALSNQVALVNRESGGAIFVDYDNDGLMDLMVMNYHTDTLFRNTGTGFVDVTSAVGLDQHLGRGESAAWADFNGDGFLDIYIVNWYYVTEADLERNDQLYMNNGGAQFINVTHMLDMQRIGGPGFAVTFLDYDNDNDQDIYVVNDKLFGNLLWRNDGAGCGQWCFTDVSISSGAHRPVFGMGIGVSDYDHDGDFDLYFTSISEMVLLQNQIAQGQELFLEVTDQAGVNMNAIGWGNFFADMDNDGFEDIYLSLFNQITSDGNRVFRNLGTGQFEDVSDSSDASNQGTSMGSAYADYDKDGRIDFILGNYGQSYKLYRNTSNNTNHWLQFEVTADEVFDRGAVGTRIKLLLDDGTVLMRYKSIGSSIGATHQPALHFGLGQRMPVSAEVTWPNGEQQNLAINGVNQTIDLRYRLEEEFLVDGFE